MPGLDDVRQICLGLPWLERLEEGRAREPNPTVLVVWVASEEIKFGLVEARPDLFFTEHHYDGYRSVMVRLDAIEPDELRDLVIEAWRLRAPNRLVTRFDLGQG